jgi:hypothetical protein
MIAAIYARKSTDDSDRNEDARMRVMSSLTRPLAGPSGRIAMDSIAWSPLLILIPRFRC